MIQYTRVRSPTVSRISPMRFIYSVTVAPVSPLNVALSPDTSASAWIKHHLFLLGYEKVRFYAYQKLSPLTMQNGGGFIKAVVSGLSSFVKSEWARDGELFQRVCSSSPLNDHAKSRDSRRFFMSLGEMMLTGKETNVRLLIDELLELYLKQVKGNVSLDTPLSSSERQILNIASNYYRSCQINYRSLYDPKTGPRRFQVGGSSFSIELPTLPQISSKQLLARALLHKEMYPALTSPGHVVHEHLARAQILEPKTSRLIRYDLSFLDGLGDLLIASESCSFLYKFRSSHPYSSDSSFGKKTFNLLRNILGTNTLLSRLAMAYNLHTALEDPLVADSLRTSYIPRACSGADMAINSYEEEFLADYFEQYVGALFLDRPDVAKEWLNELFERILCSISDSYRVSHRRRDQYHFDYRAWSVDIVGRSI